MTIKDKMKTYNFWISLVSAVLLLVRIIGDNYGFEVDSTLVMDITTGVCGIFVILGIISVPQKVVNTSVNDIKKLGDDAKMSFDDKVLIYNETFNEMNKKLQNVVSKIENNTNLVQNDLNINQSADEKLKNSIIDDDYLKNDEVDLCSCISENKNVDEDLEETNVNIIEVLSNNENCNDVVIKNEIEINSENQDDIVAYNHNNKIEENISISDSNENIKDCITEDCCNENQDIVTAYDDNTHDVVITNNCANSQDIVTDNNETMVEDSIDNSLSDFISKLSVEDIQKLKNML